MSKRDDFSKKVIERVRARVGNRCSNPNCRVATTGPTADPEKVNNIGVAAHICAASPGGPRYNASMTSKERRSIQNAIWLCGNCSTKIDRDPKKFPVKLLNSWKESAEKKAEEELGKKLQDDDYVVKSLTTALTGQPSSFIPNIIANTCSAASISLEQLDPRFSVKANYVDGLTKYQIRAKKPVTTKLLVDPKFKDEFKEKFNNFEEHGDKIEIDSQAIDISGSPLLEEIFSRKGKFELLSHATKKFTQKMWLQKPNSNEIFQFYDLNGTVVLGKSSITFQGNMCDDLLSIRYRIHRNQIATSKFKLTFRIDLLKWDKKDLWTLPYFDRIYEFLEKIHNGWSFNLAVEIEGKKLLSGTVNDFSEDEYFYSIYSQLHYIKTISEICKTLNKPIIYNYSYEYSSDEHQKMFELLEILKNGVSLTKENITENATCTLEAGEDLSNLNMLKEARDKPTSLRFIQTESQTITPFNQTLVLPKFVHTLSEVLPIIKTDIQDVKPGDLFEVEWIPTVNCKYTIAQQSAVGDGKDHAAPKQ